MGFAGIELRYTSALVLSVVFGIAVDDTIHFMAQFRRHQRLADATSGSIHGTAEQRREGDSEAALNPISGAMRVAGPGIALTSLILAAGLAPLMLSQFIPNQVLGLLLGLTALFAVLADLVMLPALLRLLER